MGPRKIRLSFLILIAAMTTSAFSNNSFAQDKNLVVRIAKLQIDSAQLESYKIAVKEQIETAIRVEPGVLTLYAVYEKNNPTHVTVFEIYANTDAYKAHLETAHFKKYKTGTKDMVKSLELMETVPIALATKSK
jgi:quinol monooxygenase YgiN